MIPGRDRSGLDIIQDMFYLIYRTSLRGMHRGWEFDGGPKEVVATLFVAKNIVLARIENLIRFMPPRGKSRR